ncbi:MAG: MBL fold metallo-hydrolase [Rhodobacteraceae bacterium]|nr:MBL fold metallo-hydrolase [Paracoccaceae bacterium]
MKRREMLCASAALMGCAGLLPARIWAQDSLALGQARLDILSDGQLLLPGDFITRSMPQEELAPIAARHALSPYEFEPPCNVTLLRDGPRKVLFDIGAGQDLMDSVGHLPQALAALAVDPAEITHLVLTHAHPDHLWGLLDDFGDPFLPNAEMLIGVGEYEYWMRPETITEMGMLREHFAVGAQRRLGRVQDRLRLFADGDEILPGVLAIGTPGHTPGHMSFHLHQDGQSVMVLADAFDNGHVAFERPHWHSGSDHDPALAAQTRQSLLSRIMAEDVPVIGYHLPGNGLGRVEQRRDGTHVFRPKSG